MHITKKHTHLILSLFFIWLLPKHASGINVSSVGIENSSINDEKVNITCKLSAPYTSMIDNELTNRADSNNMNAFLKPVDLLIASAPMDDIAEDIVFYNNTIYVANGYSGIQLFKRNSTGLKPTKQYQEHVRYVKRLFLYENYLLASNYTDGILLYKIKDNGNLIFQRALFEQFHSGIATIEIYQSRLLLLTLDGILFQYPMEKCFSEQPDISYASNVIPSVTNIVRFIISNDVLIYRQKSGMWNKKSLNNQPIDPDIHTYMKSVHKHVNNNFIYIIEYDMSYNRWLTLVEKKDSRNLSKMIRYALKDVRNIYIKNDLIYVANGFDGIAILSCGIFADNGVLYNPTQNQIFASFKKPTESKTYKLILYDNPRWYSFDNVTLKISGVNSEILDSNNGHGVIFNQKDCSVDKCTRKPEYGVIKIFFDPSINDDYVEIKSMDDDHLIKCNPYQSFYFCEDVPADKTYQFFRKINENFTVIVDMEVSVLDYCETKIDLTPPEDLYPISKETIEFNPGWNLVSFSVIPDAKSLSLLYSEASAFYSYTNNAYQRITMNDPIKAGIGYWLKLNNSTTKNITITGRNVESYSIDLNEGWHLVGSINLDNAEIVLDCTNCIGEIFFYDDAYKILSNQTFQKHIGYWIKVLKNCHLSVKGY